MPERAAPTDGHTPLPRIVVLVSGQGRNLQALIQACSDGRIAGKIVAVVSNVVDAPALARATEAGLPVRVLAHAAYPSRAAFDRALLATVDTLQPQVVALAGYMRILDDAFVDRYSGRLLNIHPSLLPRFPGLHTHRRALEAGDAEHGATVHFVTRELDGGAAVIQGRVMVEPHDDVESLANRVMREVECKIYPQVLAWFCRGELSWGTGRIWFGNRPLDTPLKLEDLQEEFR